MACYIVGAAHLLLGWNQTFFESPSSRDSCGQAKEFAIKPAVREVGERRRRISATAIAEVEFGKENFCRGFALPDFELEFFWRFFDFDFDFFLFLFLLPWLSSSDEELESCSDSSSPKVEDSLEAVPFSLS